MATKKKLQASGAGRSANSKQDNGTRQDAIALLKADHELVRDLLAQLESTSSRGSAKRRELLERIGLEVLVHAKVEEEIFYPAFIAASKTQEDHKMFFEAREEHALVHGFLPELLQTDHSTELFGARAKIIKDLIEHHAEEEERELFPRAKELMDREELVRLAEELRERKSQLMDQERALFEDAQSTDRAGELRREDDMNQFSVGSDSRTGARRKTLVQDNGHGLASR
jgi:hemerythrin superfamily protein